MSNPEQLGNVAQVELGPIAQIFDTVRMTQITYYEATVYDILSTSINKLFATGFTASEDR